MFRVPRALSEPESATINFILDADFAGVEALRAQVSTLVAVAQCDCGCPTIDLAAGADSVAAVGLEQRIIPVEAVIAPLADDPPGEIMVFADDGRLSGLEYVYYSDDPPDSWPELGRLTLR